MRLARSLAWCLALLVCTPWTVQAQDEEKAAEAPKTLALIGGRVITSPDWQPRTANLLVREGRIVAMGPDVNAPEGAEIVQLGGALIAPAWIDASHEGLFDTGQDAAHQATSSEVVASDLLLVGEADRLASLRAAGVGLVYADVRPGSGRVGGGTGSLVLADHENGLPVVHQGEAGVAFTLLGRGGSSSRTRPPTGRRGRPFPGFGRPGRANQPRATRSVLDHKAAIRAIETSFSGAERYRKDWEKFEKDLAEYEKKLAEWEKSGGKADEKKAEDKPAEQQPRRGRRGGRARLPEGFREWPREKQREWMRENMMRRRGAAPAPTRTPAATPSKSGKPRRPLEPEKKPAMERMLKVLDGEIAFRCEAHWKEEIGALLDLAEKRELKLVLMGGSEALEHADRLRESEVTVVLGAPRPRDPSRALLRGSARPDLAAALAGRGVRVAFGTADEKGIGSDHVALVAGLAIAEGLGEHAALDALTTGAAHALGHGQRVGRVAVGQVALLQVIDGEPLDPNTRTRGLVLRDRWLPTQSGGNR